MWKRIIQYGGIVQIKKPWILLRAGSSLIAFGGLFIFFGGIIISLLFSVVPMLLAGTAVLIFGVISFVGGIGVLTCREHGRRIAEGIFILLAIFFGVGVIGSFAGLIMGVIIGRGLQLYVLPLVGLTGFGFLYALGNIKYLRSEKVKKMFQQSKEKRLEKHLPPENTVAIVTCPYCQTSFQITPTKKPFKAKCPSCSKESILR